MANFVYRDTYSIDKPILAFTEGNICNVSVTVPNTNVGLNGEGKKTVPEGMFVAEVGNVIRFLPRTQLKTASITSTTTFKISPWNIFSVGDVLSVIQPYAVLTVSAVANGNTQSLTINGRTATTTLTTADTTVAATQIAAAFNADAYISQWVECLSNGATVFIFAKDGVSNLTIAESGTATATLNTTTLTVNNTPIGIVQFINYLDGTVTLTTNSTVALPIGTKIGIPVNKILGLHVHAVDYDIFSQHDLGLYTVSSGVKIQYLPYFDWEIPRHFGGRMQFDYRF